MPNLLNIFPGKKTYITGAGMVIAALLTLLAPEIASTLHIVVDDPGELLAQGLGFIFVRKGIGGNNA